MKCLFLGNLYLKTFTKQNALDYCLLNNINSDNITMLNLMNNRLTDISGIKLFKNLKELYYDNSFKNISVIQYLKNIKYVNIDNLELESDQIKYIDSCKNLKELYCKNGFKDMKAVKYLNKNIKILGLIK